MGLLFMPMSLTTPLIEMRPNSEAMSLDTGSKERLRPSSLRQWSTASNNVEPHP